MRSWRLSIFILTLVAGVPVGSANALSQAALQGINCQGFSITALPVCVAQYLNKNSGNQPVGLIRGEHFRK